MRQQFVSGIPAFLCFVLTTWPVQVSTSMGATICQSHVYPKVDCRNIYSHWLDIILCIQY